MNKEDILAEVHLAPMRWGFGVLLMYVLGVILAVLAVRAPEIALGVRIILMALGAGALYLGERSRKIRYIHVILHADGLVDSSGTQITTLENIRSIDRGALAFKPSNGFLLRLHERGPRAWVPGLWWRMGRSVGVGGSTQSGQAKFMAEMIAARLAARKTG